LAALSRAGDAVTVTLEKFEPVTRGAIAPVFCFEAYKNEF